jgi:phosphoglucosamine mutase
MFCPLAIMAKNKSAPLLGANGRGGARRKGSMGRIFGTDGVRGIVGCQLTAEVAMNIGRAAAMVLAEQPTAARPRVLIGKDPRLSSDMLEAAVAAGLCAVGADVLRVGVLPTPAVAYLVRHYKADAGVMISASHNPAPYNGIKLFGADGYKLSDALEDEIEAIILDGARPYPVKTGAEIGRITEDAEAARTAYVDYIAGLAQGKLAGLRLLVDCANGAASTTTRPLLERLGVSFDLIFDKPDGLNINADCGSTCIGALGERVRAGHYDLGLAFDGDADRLLAVDEKGQVFTGDHIMAFLGRYLKAQGRLKKDTIAITPMTNMGFYGFAEAAGIQTAVTKVGDRYVLEYLLEHGCNFGGEQSGHFIFLDYHTTGDGALSAVLLLNALAASGGPLSVQQSIMEVYPQRLLGVKATPAMKAALTDHPGVARAIEDARAALGRSGRVDVRPSGTEPLIRVMVEGESDEKISAVGQTLAATIEEYLGPCE